MDQPAWLAAAWRELGVRETQGNSSNQRVLAYYREAGHGEIGSDEVPWCAAFVGAMLSKAGVAASGSLMARSYLAWGEALSEPRLGAVAVLQRGTDPSAGHTGFLIGETREQIILLGGNQADSVSVAAFQKSRLIGYRWPPALAASVAVIAPNAGEGAGSEAVADVFASALANVIELEGGYSDDPYDPGGPTNKGITLAVYAQFRGVTADAISRARLIEDLRRIPDDAVRDIYHARYWLPAQCPSLPPALAFFHFDAAVNHGVRGAARLLQKALNVTADGEIGPLTLAAAMKGDPRDLLAKYAETRRKRYRELAHFWRFGRGWLKRVDISLAGANGMITSEIHMTDNRKGGSAMDQSEVTVTDGKWWAQSKTIWGAAITAAATVIPVLGPVVGIELSGDVIRQAGEQTLSAIQACAGLFGTLLTIYGRLKADGPLIRRNMNVKL